MNTWILVWFIIALLTTGALVVLGVNLGRHLMILGRTAKQMQEELQPIVDDIGQQGAVASQRASSLKPPTSGRHSAS